jgi:hypothetical protein
MLTGGPHNNSGSTVERPWSALDFNGAAGTSTAVRAARDGVVSRPCANLIRIDHGSGWQTHYYHVKDIAVVQGQTVTRGQYLGNTSTESGCGGFAEAPHVHFTLRKFGIFQEINNQDIGGWNVQQGSQPYSGCLVKNGISRCAPGELLWNDGGIGSACPVGQMQATYYNNRALSGNPTFWRCEAAPYYDWGNGSPGNGIGNDNFSIRWAGQYDFDGRRYRFSTQTDDGVRLWLDKKKLIDHWENMPPTTYNKYKTVTGRRTMMMEYYENGGGAVAKLSMAPNLAQGMPSHSTSEFQEYFPSNGNDGDIMTRWSSAMIGRG